MGLDKLIYALVRKGELNFIKLLGKTVSGVTTLIKDGSGKILLCTGTTKPADAGAGYAKGCIFIKTDVVTGSSGLYENVGTSSSCNFNQFASTATKFNEIGDADGAGSVSLGTNQQTIISTKTDGDGIIIDGQGNFGDVSVLRVQSSTGNPTDGTVLEVVAHDANVDPLLVVSAADGPVSAAFKVGQDGNVRAGGDLTVDGTLSAGTFGADAVTASTTNQTLALNGDGAGGVNICSTSTGGITLGDDVTVSDGKNVTIGEGYLVIDNDAINETALTITSAGTTSGGAVNIVAATTTGDVISITADDLGTGGSVIKIDTDNIAADNFYIECYNGTADEFTVSRYGATVIAGNASTDVLTITAGNVQVTAGNIDVDEGKIEIDTAVDITSYIKRNQGATTGPVLELEETAAAADNAVLLVDQNATAATSYGIEIDSAGGTCLLVNPEAVTGDGIQFSVPADYTGQLIKVNDTLVGTSGEGIIDIKTTANLADGATLVRLDFDTGTMAGAHNGFMLSVDDDSVGVGTSYAVEINSENNEALIVSKGKASFTEQIICTAGIDSNGGLDVDLATNADLVNIDNAAVDLATGTGVVTVFGSGEAGQTNAAYLMRLAWKADGDAQDNFILCQDNSTGAAGNGDEMFKVTTGGAVTATGLTTLNGGSSLGAQTELTLDDPAGAITITHSYHSVDTYEDAASDELNTISGGVEGQILVLRANNSGRTIVVKNGTGNILCGADVTLDNVADTITLLYDGANWLKLSSSDNAA